MKMMEQVFLSIPRFPAFGQYDDHQQDNDEEGGHSQEEKLIV